MNIGLDLDQTLVENNIINKVSKRMGYFPKFKQESIADWNMSNFPKELVDNIIKEFYNSQSMNDVKIIGDARSVLTKWAIEGHYMIIITARSKPVRNETMRMVSRLFPMISELTFVDVGCRKIEQMKRHNIDVWIDDNSEGINDAQTLGIKTFLITNSTTPYNFQKAQSDCIAGRNVAPSLKYISI